RPGGRSRRRPAPGDRRRGPRDPGDLYDAPDRQGVGQGGGSARPAGGAHSDPGGPRMSEFRRDETSRGGLIALRRALHTHPETGLDLPQTQSAILAALDGLGLEVTTGSGLTSVTAVLRGGRPGPAVL